MIKSMTGYGKAEITIPGRNLSIELRSLNSKGLDINIKLPSWLREKELDIRNHLQTLQRGKIDLFIQAELTGIETGATLNHDVAMGYYKELKQLQKEMGESREELLPLVMKMPDVMGNQKETITPEALEEVFSGILDVIHQTNQFREIEGGKLHQDLSDQVHEIIHLLDQITPMESTRTLRIREQLSKSLDLLAENGNRGELNENRFEQEMIYYLEKMDFTEEKVRLKSHCTYFTEMLNEPDSQGKKLGFICQEMGREINTLGSKAADAGIQRLVVQMKDALEKIKEQLLNIL